MVTYTYNAANQVETIEDWDDQTTIYGYDTNGRPVTMTLPNGVVTTMGYDDAGRLTTLLHKKGATTIGSYTYTYDGTGRRSTVVDTSRTTTYTYDGLYRLTHADESTGDDYYYTYDAAGNRLTKTEPSGSVAATYDVVNQLATLNSGAVSYDANGNLLNDGSATYAYDDLDRLVSTTRGGTTTAFEYTGDGDRLLQIAGGVTTTFTLDLNAALAQVLGTSDGTTDSFFLPGVGQETGNAWLYYHTDALGSVRNVTGSAGTSLGSMRYSPFGERTDSTGILPFMGFTGEPQDPSSDLTYLRARYYNPELGRFLTPDAIVPDAANGQAWNPYTYVYNDAVNSTDPSGFDTNWLDSTSRYLQQQGSNVSEWWNAKGDQCDCKKASPNPTDPNSVAYPFQDEYWVTQIAWAKVTAPAERLGRATIQKLVQVSSGSNSKSWQWVDDVVIKNISNRLRWWNFLNRSGTGTYRIGLRTRAIVENTEFRLTHGPVGFVNTALGAGVIDGVFQGVNDFFAEPCLTNGQRVGRVAVAFAFGTVAGLGGALVYGGILYVGFAAPIALGGSFVAGAVFGELLSPTKQQRFEDWGLSTP